MTKENVLRNLMITTIIALLAVSVALAAESSSYSIEKEHTGLAGGSGDTTSNNYRFTQDHNQGTDKEGESSTYSVNVGWFDQVIDPQPPAPTPSGGGGGGGGAACNDECLTEGATICSENNAVLTCGQHDVDSCLEWGNPQSCGTGTCQDGVCKECQENWICEEWDTCSPDGLQERNCYDFNNCASEKARPATQRSCTPEPITVGTGGTQSANLGQVVLTASIVTIGAALAGSLLLGLVLLFGARQKIHDEKRLYGEKGRPDLKKRRKGVEEVEEHIKRINEELDKININK